MEDTHRHFPRQRRPSGSAIFLTLGIFVLLTCSSVNIHESARPGLDRRTHVDGSCRRTAVLHPGSC